MPDLNLITRCGIYCGACYIYRAERDRGDFLLKVAKEQNSESYEIKCNGCFAPDEQKWKNCKKCYPQKCLDEKGLKFCTECSLFLVNACKQYIILSDFCFKRGENTRKNLIDINKDPVKYLNEQDKKWRCKHCGKTFSWYETTCHHCGKELNRLNE